MLAIPDRDQCKAELDVVIASGIFAKAPSLASLLDYVCTRLFEGQAHQIKEYSIAVEALGRPATFDPKQDSIVRVEAFRLRKRLKQFYENEGAGRHLRIVIPPGQYVPQFQENGHAAGNGEHDSGIDHIDEDEVVLDVAPLPAPQPDLALASQPAGLQIPSAGLLPQPRRSRWLAWVAWPLVLAAAVAVGVWYLRAHVLAKTVSGPKAAAVPLAGESEEIRILCGVSGARFADRAGNVWSGDRYFRGGSVFATPNHTIFRTADPDLFRHRREGDFSYDIPLKPGIYELHLYFAETLFGEDNTAGGGESTRVFHVSLNGKDALGNFDVLSDAGGSNTADERVFKDISPGADGILHVRFTELVNNLPFLNALEIVPGIPGQMRPVRIVARARDYTDQRGQVWGADRYYSHGLAVSRPESVVKTPDPEMFQSERYGNFRYTIPVAEGRYTVNLRFAETWFGPGRPGGGRVGSRLFDVYCNGAALLRNFDIFRTAGGELRAIEKSFHGIVPNAQGKIELSFVPVVNYASINAIEVLDDSDH
jgi:hypothetical protein